MKKCTICKEEKELCEFNKRSVNKDGYQNICRECSNERSRKYYENNREKHIETITKRGKKTLKENRQKVYDYYKTHSCVDCGESNPVVLEFDHRDGVDKKGSISSLIGNGCSWNTIKEEIDKCDVRCANCHRIRTAEQLGWYVDLT